MLVFNLSTWNVEKKKDLQFKVIFGYTASLNVTVVFFSEEERKRGREGRCCREGLGEVGGETGMLIN